MTGHALELELREAGILVRVETRERVALVIPDVTPAGDDPGTAWDALVSSESRRRILDAARRHGFANAAIELPDEPDEALRRG